MNISILYEDDLVIAFNKPAGLLVHGDGRPNGPTLVDWIKEHRPEVVGAGENIVLASGEIIERPGIVHRLDKDTSGVILVAKNHDVFLFLKEQFQLREVYKVYSAFVYGRIKDMEGSIDRQIGRSASDFRKWSAQRGARGALREAVTDYRCIKATDEWSFVEVYPKTGRTHQIRVHFKAIHHPLVCDALYAPNHKCLLGFKRTALHALSISFLLPDGQRMIVTAPYPEDFKRGLRQ